MVQFLLSEMKISERKTLRSTSALVKVVTQPEESAVCHLSFFPVSGWNIPGERQLTENSYSPLCPDGAVQRQSVQHPDPLSGAGPLILVRNQLKRKRGTMCFSHYFISRHLLPHSSVSGDCSPRVEFCLLSQSYSLENIVIAGSRIRLCCLHSGNEGLALEHSH